MKSILDPTFRYVNSQHTDVRKTFARVRRQLAAASRVSPGVVNGSANVHRLVAKQESVA